MCGFNCVSASDQSIRFIHCLKAGQNSHDNLGHFKRDMPVKTLPCAGEAYQQCLSILRWPPKPIARPQWREKCQEFFCLSCRKLSAHNFFLTSHTSISKCSRKLTLLDRSNQNYTITKLFIAKVDSSCGSEYSDIFVTIIYQSAGLSIQNPLVPDLYESVEAFAVRGQSFPSSNQEPKKCVKQMWREKTDFFWWNFYI